MDRHRVALVVPAYNEAETIAGVVDGLKNYGLVIVVNDGSSDGTGFVARKMGVPLVSHEKNQGYDSALNSGFEKAFEMGCVIAITVDADGQHDPTLICKYIALMLDLIW